ncbi:MULTISPECIES: hypothetical protein [Amycolatopsis]|nr:MULTISPECIES: hypothetical protein [Amycolatopsis]OAP28775.1 hypothetical protein A4R44_00567 [Amycolatopsis sp. M39]
MEHPFGTSGEESIPDGFQVEQWTQDLDEEFRLVRNESFPGHWGATPDA